MLEQENSLNKPVVVKTPLGEVTNDNKLFDKVSDVVLLKKKEAQPNDPSQYKGKGSP